MECDLEKSILNMLNLSFFLEGHLNSSIKEKITV